MNICNYQKIYFIDRTIHSKKEILLNIKNLKANDGVVFRNNATQNFQEIQNICKHKKILIFSDFRNKILSSIQHFASSNKILHYHKNDKKSISFHSTPDLHRLHHIKPDFIFISPVFFTKTHPERKPLGKIKTIKLCQIIKEIFPNTKIFLLGGMNKKKFHRITKTDSQNLIQGYAGIRNIND